MKENHKEHPDDIEAVRTLVKTLEPFEAREQERIIRWASEKLGMSVQGTATAATAAAQPASPVDTRSADLGRQLSPPRDIKTFVSEKNPSRDNEFVATVAYYYRFVAPESARKGEITAEDLQEACRLTGKNRFMRPAQTLINAHTSGLLDKAGDRGGYAISTVGENLVAVTLPSGGSPQAQATTGSARAAPKRKTRSSKRNRGKTANAGKKRRT